MPCSKAEPKAPDAPPARLPATGPRFDSARGLGDPEAFLFELHGVRHPTSATTSVRP